MIIKNTKGTSERDRALLWVAKAAAADPFRNYAMTGVLFTRVDDGRVAAVATDGSRLHLAVFPETCLDYWDVTPSEEYPTRIDRRNTRELALGSLMKHTYPNYRRVIPDDQPHSIDASNFREGAARHFLGQLLVAIQDAGYLIPRFDPRFIEDVGEMVVGRVSFGEVAKAFRFDSHYTDPFQRLAVVMPMQRVMR